MNLSRFASLVPVVFILMLGCGGAWQAGLDGAAAESRGLSSGHQGAALVATRPYRLRVPKGRDPNVPAPLVVLLHGYAGNADTVDWYFDLDDELDARGVLLATPNGTTDFRGLRFWNATTACCNFRNVAVDDVAYFNAIIDDVSSRENVDPQRIFVVGHSNGAFMAHRLACEASGRIAGIVSLAGAADIDETHCHPSEAVAVLEVHGNADTTISYAGGQVSGMGAPYPSTEVTVSGWASRNGCEPVLHRTGETLDLDSSLPGNETFVEHYDNCRGGAAERWTIQGGKHIPDLTSAWAGAILKFLAAHPKP